MNKYISIILIGITLLSCSSEKYMLADKTSDSTRLIDLIEQLKKEDKINKNPVLVINDNKIERKELRNLKIVNSEIMNIAVIEKKNSKMAQIYGKQSKNGIILIETKPLEEKPFKGLSESNVLFIVDGKKVKEKYFRKINPDDIQTVTVIKNKKDILKYTKKDQGYDGVIIVEMKKD